VTDTDEVSPPAGVAEDEAEDEAEDSAIADELKLPIKTPPPPGTAETVEAAADVELEAGWAEDTDFDVDEAELAVDAVLDIDTEAGREVALVACGTASAGAD